MDEKSSSNPFLLPDMQQAVSRIYRALLSGENIAVYGDYDADGIAGTALLVKGLSYLGGNVIPYIPHRLTEGYGLKTTALKELHQQNISLVITVDCGITDLSQVKQANRMGLDVIITDHHNPLPEIPPAIASVNPKRTDSIYPFSELSGTGVAYKLLQALFQSLGKEEKLMAFLDLVALGTIADMTPLVSENRYLVKQGLKLINNHSPLWITELMAQTGYNGDNLDEESFSWVLAPRINAAGRLAHAMNSYKLLMSESPEEARQLAIWLEEKNVERQKLTIKFLNQAREQILSREFPPLLIASDHDYPVGIIGLIAGRLTEEFYRPTIAIRTGELNSTGSCRSIPEFNIIHALNQCRSLLSHFGGHSQAAGFTLPTKNLAQFNQQLSQLATLQLAKVDLRPQLNIDTEITLDNLGGDTFQNIQQLTPFGHGNPIPIFLSKQVEVINCRSMGSNGDHLRIKLKQGNSIWDGVAFKLGSFRNDVATPLDIVYNLAIDRWQGVEKLRLNILDFKQSFSNNLQR